MWWSTILNFFKNKVMSYNGVFISIFIVFISIFIFSNLNVILSKLGFETTTNLKAEVTRLQSELKEAQRVNRELENNLTTQEKQHQSEIKAIVDSFKEREKIQENINKAQKKKKTKDKEIAQKLNNKTIVNSKTITIPIYEYNELSKNNIETLNEVYDSFFSVLGGKND